MERILMIATIFVVYCFLFYKSWASFFGSSISTAENVELLDPSNYGVDHSFPIHNYLNKNNPYEKSYRTMLKGCYSLYSRRECESTEEDRIFMNRDQPRTQHNYTEVGFKKVKVPKEVWDAVSEFFNKNKNSKLLEEWPRGNTYVNHWDSPTYMVSFENSRLRGGLDVKQKIWDGMKPIIEEWTGKTIIPTSLYGIRIYTGGAVLATHVDRLPLVSSCIIQVSQDVDEPWPIEVYSHDGRAHNVTMQPGDAVLYESATVLHGRPFPMKGRHYANIFVHFSPVDHDLVNAQDELVRQEVSQRPPSSQSVLDTNSQMINLLKDNRKRFAGHEQENGDIFEDDGIEGRTALHVAAAQGNLKRLAKLLGKNDRDLLHVKDENEWQAIHEAARAGHLDALRYLIDMGADVAAQTSNGGTPLWWARHSLEEGHPVIQYLEEIGAPEGSEL